MFVNALLWIYYYYYHYIIISIILLLLLSSFCDFFKIWDIRRWHLLKIEILFKFCPLSSKQNVGILFLMQITCLLHVSWSLYDVNVALFQYRLTTRCPKCSVFITKISKITAINQDDGDVYGHRVWLVISMDTVSG